jgi:hypothetical protein
VVVGAYCMLLLLGALEGLIGCFQYSRALGSFPVAAVAFAVAIGVTCVLGAWGMHRPLGGLMPAVGWFITSFVLAMGTPGGSVVITNAAAGKWYLFGGSACAAAGVVFGFVRWSPARTGVPRRGGLRPGRSRVGALGAPNPGAPKPVASQPGAPKPVASQPGASKPVASQPGAPKPGASQPGVSTPDGSQPGAPQLDARKPDL